MRKLHLLMHGMLLCLLLALSCQLKAQDVDLYRAVVPVTGQDPKTLQTALAQALAQVIVKVGGQKSLLQAPAVKAAMREPNRYVLQFGYENVQTSTDGNASLHLAVSFQPEPIRQLLRSNGLPIWPTPRPDLLVWLVVDETGARKMVGGEHHPVIVTQLRSAAAVRGVGLSMPLQDLEDDMALGENELWQFERDAVEQASKRYSKDTILFGRVSVTATGALSGSWQLLHRGDVVGFEGSGADAAQYIQAGVDRVAEVLAAKYAVVTRAGGGGAMQLVVDNVATYGDYAQTLTYLQRMEGVSKLEVRAVQGSTVYLSANINDVAQLQQMLSLDRQLRPADAPAQSSASAPTSVSTTAQPATLYFRWAGGNP